MPTEAPLLLLVFGKNTVTIREAMKITTALVFCLLLLTFSTQSLAQDDTSHGGFDDIFSQYIPEVVDYDIDNDEKFMYWGKNIGVLLGTGLQTWSGNLGSFLKEGVPTFDFRVLFQVDHRFMTSLGFGYSSFDGVPTASASEIEGSLGDFLARNSASLVKLEFFRLNLSLRYYFQNGHAEREVASPALFIIGGLGMFYGNVKSNSQSDSAKINTADISSLPVVPFLGAGVDVAIIPRRMSFTLEGRYTPIALLRSTVGSLLEVNLASVFMF